MHTKNVNPRFERHLPLGIRSIFVPVTIFHSSNCHALLWNPQYAPLASVFLNYCSLWSAFCVPFDMGQILTWGAESCIMWILFVSQRNLPFSIPLYLGQHLAQSPPFPRQPREKTPETHQSTEQPKPIHLIIIIKCHRECQLGIVVSVFICFVEKLSTLKKVPENERKEGKICFWNWGLWTWDWNI